MNNPQQPLTHELLLEAGFDAWHQLGAYISPKGKSGDWQLAVAPCLAPAPEFMAGLCLDEEQYMSLPVPTLGELALFIKAAETCISNHESGEDPTGEATQKALEEMGLGDLFTEAGKHEPLRWFDYNGVTTTASEDDISGIATQRAMQGANI